MAIPFSRKAHWTFVGDSITDCGQRECPEGIGAGYVRLIRDWLYALDPAKVPKITNTGISGDRVWSLQRRWNDVLALKPDLISIKIGINDVWHNIPPTQEGTDLARYREVYHDILRRLRDNLPDTTLVLCEPSVIWPPAPEIGNELLSPYIEVVRDLAQEFSAVAVVPLHAAFNNARAARPDVDWAPDGVHPASSGHMLIARTWLASLGLL